GVAQSADSLPRSQQPNRFLATGLHPPAAMGLPSPRPAPNLTGAHFPSPRACDPFPAVMQPPFPL
ncbi:MAG: hypothetical protein OEZ02_04660, partial [Anaerolineae bacterium]|nr:hypothetical protein [Anaerolineae bacterium]